MVAVDQRRVDRRQLGQHLVADRPMEVVAAGEAALVLGGVELRHGVDHVDLGLRPEQVEQLHSRLALQGADLDHPLGAGGAEDGAMTLPQSGYISVA